MRSSFDRKKGQQQDTSKTAYHELGPRKIKIVMERVYNAKVYNTNRYYVIEEVANYRGTKEEIDTEVTSDELTTLERGHYYISRRAAEDSWYVSCPFRFADEETAAFGKGVRPIPTDRTTLDKYREGSHRWQYIDGDFYLTPLGYRSFKARVEVAGGHVEEVHANMDILRSYHRLIFRISKQCKEFHGRIDAVSREIETGQGDQSSVDRITELKDQIERLNKEMGRSRDMFLHELGKLQNEWGRVEEKREAEDLVAAVEASKERVANYWNSVATKEQEATLMLGMSITKGGRKTGKLYAPETLKAAIDHISGVFPQFSHIKPSDDGQYLMIEYLPNRFIRISKERAEIWTPQVVARRKGRFGALDLKTPEDSPQ